MYFIGSNKYITSNHKTWAKGNCQKNQHLVLPGHRGEGREGEHTLRETTRGPGDDCHISEEVLI